MIYRRKPSLTETQARFLAVLREVYPGGGGTFQAARRIGVDPDKVQRWRDRNRHFKATMDKLKLELEGHREAIKLAEAKVSLEPDAEGNLPGNLLVYAAVWRQTQDRKLAWERAAITWKQVKEARATFPAFEALCSEIEEEFQVQAEDANARRAVKEGGAAANAFFKQSATKKKPAAATDRRSRVAQLRAEKGAPN